MVNDPKYLKGVEAILVGADVLVGNVEAGALPAHQPGVGEHPLRALPASVVLACPRSDPSKRAPRHQPRERTRTARPHAK